MSKDKVFRKEAVYNHPPEKIWTTLTDKRALAATSLLATGGLMAVVLRFAFREKVRTSWLASSLE